MWFSYVRRLSAPDMRTDPAMAAQAGRMRSRRMPSFLLVFVLLVPIACKRSLNVNANTDASTDTLRQAPASAATDPNAPRLANDEVSELNLLDQLPSCEIDQLGPVAEIGTSVERARRGYGVAADIPSQTVDRNGGKFTRIYERRLTHELWLDEPMERPRVTVRLVGAAANRVTVLLDKTVIGGAKLMRGEPVTRVFGPTEGIVEIGRHIITLEFKGQARNKLEPSAEIDWIHVGQQFEGDAIPTAPTLRTLVADQNIGGIPKRSIVLRAPSSLRCPLLLAAGTRLRVSLGFWGNGSGLGEIRIIEDGLAPVALRQQKTLGGNGANWTPIDVDLSPYANRIVALEFRALRASQGGKVVFGEPRITRIEPAAVTAVAKPRLAVVVVAAGLSRRKIPPWGPTGAFAGISALQHEAAAFQNYRAASTVPGSVMATLLTGLRPGAHHVQDTAARLPSSLPTIQHSLKQASGRTAMFTGVPTTFPAFGFGEGWDELQSFSPVKDQSASEPIIQATHWLQRELELEDDTKRFVLVHVRGMHPPWDLTKEVVSALQPAEYGGALEARRGGITLGRIRKQSQKTLRRLTDEDWVRLDSLSSSGLIDQSQALDQMIHLLKRRNVWQQTLFIFMGDVGAGEPPNVPFDPVGSLREDQLIVPLLVKFPNGLAAGRSIETPISTANVTRTLYGALGLDLSEASTDSDLSQIAANRGPVVVVPLIATLGNRYASRLSNWLLFGEIGKEPGLCELYVDPACTTNHFLDHPWTARASWQWTRNELVKSRTRGANIGREPASIDPETAAALVVWGDVDQ